MRQAPKADNLSGPWKTFCGQKQTIYRVLRKDFLLTMYRVLRKTFCRQKQKQTMKNFLRVLSGPAKDFLRVKQFIGSKIYRVLRDISVIFLRPYFLTLITILRRVLNCFARAAKGPSKTFCVRSFSHHSYKVLLLFAATDILR